MTGVLGVPKMKKSSILNRIGDLSKFQTSTKLEVRELLPRL